MGLGDYSWKTLSWEEGWDNKHYPEQFKLKSKEKKKSSSKAIPQTCLQVLQLISCFNKPKPNPKSTKQQKQQPPHKPIKNQTSIFSKSHLTLIK